VSEYQLARGVIQRFNQGRLTMKLVSEGCDMTAVCCVDVQRRELQCRRSSTLLQHEVASQTQLLTTGQSASPRAPRPLYADLRLFPLILHARRAKVDCATPTALLTQTSTSLYARHTLDTPLAQSAIRSCFHSRPLCADSWRRTIANQSCLKAVPGRARIQPPYLPPILLLTLTSHTSSTYPSFRFQPVPSASGLNMRSY